MKHDELERLIDLGLSLQKPFADRVTLSSGDFAKFMEAVRQAIEQQSRIDTALAIEFHRSIEGWDSPTDLAFDRALDLVHQALKGTLE